jgi:hypothetical protein
MTKFVIRHKETKKYFTSDEGGVFLTDTPYYLFDGEDVDNILLDGEDDYFYDETTGDEVSFSELEVVKVSLSFEKLN